MKNWRAAGRRAKCCSLRNSGTGSTLARTPEWDLVDGEPVLTEVLNRVGEVFEVERLLNVAVDAEAVAADEVLSYRADT